MTDPQSFDAPWPPVATDSLPHDSDTLSADIVIVGSGMGGATAAYALRRLGAAVVLVERGGFLPREAENWSPRAVFVDGRYRNAERWLAQDGTEFDPGVYYYVGGNTKFYGAMLPRFREQDFGPISYPEGTSPSWPISYAEMEPFYADAERMYSVHGGPGDPTDPWRSGPYPFPALAHSSDVAGLADSMRGQGLHPFVMPAAVRTGDAGGNCVLCNTCDGYPCKVDGKGDADVGAVRLAVAAGVRLLTHARVDRLSCDSTGRTVTEAVVQSGDRQVRIRANRFILGAGAVNTAALLLASADSSHSNGLGNSSGQVGRNYMVHNSTFMVAVHPTRRNRTVFQKTLALNDWYLPGEASAVPLGHVQMLGKLFADSIRTAKPRVPTAVLRYMTQRSMDLYISSEDLPSPANRVRLDGANRIVVDWTPTNLGVHHKLVAKATRAMRRAGYPLVFRERMGIAVNSHQCGTAVMGADPTKSVVAPSGRLHDVDNVWIVDSSTFPSSAAVNPALTIAANALRVVHTGGVSET